MLSLTFGTESQIRRTADRINAIHQRVHGRLDRAVGRYAAGTPYDATDPALLTWVHSTLIDSQLRTHALFVGPLTADEEDRYCAETARIGPRLGDAVERAAGHEGQARSIPSGNAAAGSSRGRRTRARTGGGAAGAAGWALGGASALARPAHHGRPAAVAPPRQLRIRVARKGCPESAVGSRGGARRPADHAAGNARVARRPGCARLRLGATTETVSQFSENYDIMSRFS